MKFFSSLASLPYFATRSLCTQAKSGRLKASFACPKAHRDQFVISTAQMTISVGQLVHEGERLQSITQLINRSFSSCKILIDDSIQSYTLAIGAKNKSKAELLEKAILVGDEYLQRNTPIFKANFTIPYEIIRWRDWLHTPAWQNAIQSMHISYDTNTHFRQAIDHSVQTFLARYERHYADDHYHRARAEYLCTEYLLEECGVMKDLWVKLGCHFEVYPGGRNEAMAATYALFIEPLYPQLLRSVAVRFNRRHAAATSLKEGTPDDTEETNYHNRAP